MTFWPVEIDQEWHERLQARLMARGRQRRAAEMEAGAMAEDLAAARAIVAKWLEHSLYPPPVEPLRALLTGYNALAARLADIWLLVDLWDQGTEGSLETLERLAKLKRDAGAAGEGR